MMTPLIKIEATSSGLFDYSESARPMASDLSRLSVIDGHHYYDLRGDSVWSWPGNPVFNADAVFTIEAWLMLADGQYQTLFASLAQGSFVDGIALYASSTETELTSGGVTAEDTVKQAITVDTLKPVHIAWVLDGTNKKIYINGNISKISTIVSPPSKNPLLLIFGGSQNSFTNAEYPASKAKVSQFIFWDGVKYTGNFIPEREVSKVLSLSSIGGFYSSKTNSMSSRLSITDKVLVKGVPAKRKVCLYHRGTNKLVATTWSDNAGNYRFDNLRPNAEYYVLALDHERNYNAVIQDMLRAD